MKIILQEKQKQTNKKKMNKFRSKERSNFIFCRFYGFMKISGWMDRNLGISHVTWCFLSGQ